MPNPRSDTVQTEAHVSTSLRRLYISHFLSAWNSRLFEFGAVLFLAIIKPGTLLYASIYAFVRSFSAILLASKIGQCIDEWNRLRCIQTSILMQRVAVSLSCVLFGLWVLLDVSPLISIVLFSGLVLLACVEKVGYMANMVAVERDWLPIISAHLECDRSTLNASMRRIDLTCKLAAPVVISLVQSFSTIGANITILLLSLVSMSVEYTAIASVYATIPELAQKETHDALPLTTGDIDEPEALQSIKSRSNTLETWTSYFQSPVFLPSLALSLLYLTVLSTGVQYQTYMLSTNHTALAVSIIRLIAVISELSATCLAPVIIAKVGQIRSGLWSVNWQVVILLVGVGSSFWTIDSSLASWYLTAAIIISRVGLWGFDLAVQDIVQEKVPESKRGTFSACEMGLQNLFELLSFGSTILFPNASQFRYPVMISLGAVLSADCCYAAYVRQERGHLIHFSSCIKEEAYREVAQEEPVELSS
jgi:iron-regulated transporter 1